MDASNALSAASDAGTPPAPAVGTGAPAAAVPSPGDAPSEASFVQMHKAYDPSANESNVEGIVSGIVSIVASGTEDTYEHNVTSDVAVSPAEAEPQPLPPPLPKQHRTNTTGSAASLPRILALVQDDAGVGQDGVAPVSASSPALPALPVEEADALPVPLPEKDSSLAAKPPLPVTRVTGPPETSQSGAPDSMGTDACVTSEDDVEDPTIEPIINRKGSAVARDIQRAMNSSLMHQTSIDSVESAKKAGETLPPNSDELAEAELAMHIDNVRARGATSVEMATELVLKLHARILEIKREKKAMQDKHDDCVHDLEQQLARKNAAIEATWVKMQRYEYALKESVVFLSKPLREYEAQLEADAAAHRDLRIIPSVISAADPAAALSEPKSPQSPGTMSVHAAPDGSPNIVAPRTGLAVNTVSPASSSAPPSKITSMTVFEIRCIESIRLAHQYMKHVQDLIQQTGPSVSLKLPALSRAEDTMSVTSDSTKHSGDSPRSITAASAPSSAGGSSGSGQPLNATLGAATSPIKTGVSGSASDVSKVGVKSKGRGRSASSNAAAAAAQALMLDQDEGDVADVLGDGYGGGNRKSLAASKRCENCLNLMLKVDSLNDDISGLKRQIADLEGVLETTRAQCEKTRLEKELVEGQLEDLTIELFEQANKLVSDESKLRDKLEQTVRSLEATVKEVSAKCSFREESLRECMEEISQLRFRLLVAEKKLCELKQLSPQNATEVTDACAPGIKASTLSLYAKALSTPIKSLTHIAHTNKEFRRSVYQMGDSKLIKAQQSQQAQQQHQLQHQQPQQQQYPPPVIPVIHIDGVVYAEFQDHIRQVIKDVAANPVVSHTTVFMKRALIEDVEPCLFSTSVHDSSKTSLFKSSSSQLPAATKKRLMEAVSKAGCEIQSYIQALQQQQQLLQQHPQLQVQLGHSVVVASTGGDAATNAATAAGSNSADPPKNKCMLCCVTRECEFRMRFLSPTSEWFGVCRFCRDRVVSVCDFYNYLLMLRQRQHHQLFQATQGGKMLQPTNQQGTTQQQNNQSLLSMYRHVLWLRRRMAAARIGSMSMFESEIFARLSQYTRVPVIVGSSAGGAELPSEWEQWVNVVN